MAIQKSNETEIESNEIIRQHIIENQQLRTDFHHSLIAIDARWRNLLGEQVTTMLLLCYYYVTTMLLLCYYYVILSFNAHIVYIP